MKKRVKKKLRKRYGYKRYDYYRAYLDAIKASNSFLEIARKCKDGGVIVLVSCFKNSKHYHHHFCIFPNNTHSQDLIFDPNVKLLIIEVSDLKFKPGKTKRICTNRGYILYKKFKDSFIGKDAFFIVGSLDHMTKYRKYKIEKGFWRRIDLGDNDYEEKD